MSKFLQNNDINNNDNDAKAMQYLQFSLKTAELKWEILTVVG